MEKIIYLDTHVLIWLYAGEIKLLSPAASTALQTNKLLVSPIVISELQYLYEIKRISEPSSEIMRSLAQTMDLAVCNHNFQDVVANSARQSWTRDPFDRLIVAQASIKRSRLLTKDNTILKHYKNSFW